MSYDKKRNKVHCFGCGSSYDIFDLIGIDNNLITDREIFKKAAEMYDIDNLDNLEIVPKQEPEKPIQDLTSYFQRVHGQINKTDYPQLRGLSETIINRFNLGFDDAFIALGNGPMTKWNALIIPTGKGSFVARNTSPDASKENRIRKTGSSPLYNIQALTESKKPIFITEGEIDALSIMEVGGEAIGLGSTANARAFIKALQTNKPSQRLILSLDNDDIGQQTSAQIAKELETMNIPFSTANISGNYKDPNEALMNNREGFEQSVKEASKTEKDDYLTTSAAHYLRSFVNGINDSVNTPVIPTGFPNLDKLLDGGLYEGLYIFGAISSLGKTTLITQIGDQIAQAGTDVLIFSLEMSRFEIMAKSISRQTFIQSIGNSQIKNADTRNAKTIRGITSGRRYEGYSKEEKELIGRSINAYGKYAQNIFITEGTGDIGVKEIRESIEKHISLTGKKPIVIIDYLQIIAPHNEKMSDKQNTDKAVLELKRISRDFKIPVIGISSFNRASYSNTVSMEAFKESGAIEYSSDVLIGLQLKGAGEKEFNAKTVKLENPRRIELTILKNRNGTMGDVNFSYYSYFNYFVEN